MASTAKPTQSASANAREARESAERASLLASRHTEAIAQLQAGQSAQASAIESLTRTVSEFQRSTHEMMDEMRAEQRDERRLLAEEIKTATAAVNEAKGSANRVPASFFAILLAGLAFLGSVGALAVNPLSDNIAENEADLETARRDIARIDRSGSAALDASDRRVDSLLRRLDMIESEWRGFVPAYWDRLGYIRRSLEVAVDRMDEQAARLRVIETSRSSSADPAQDARISILERLQQDRNGEGWP